MRFYPDGSFDPALCIRCWRCSTVCPSGAVNPGENGIPSFNTGVCINCGHCASFCPPNAFHLEESADDHSVPFTDFLGLVSRRRSVRHFDRGEISDAELDSLLGVVGYSPTGTNACGILVRAYRGEDARSLHVTARKAIRPLWDIGLLRIAGALSGMTPYLRRFIAGEDLIFRQAPLVLFFHSPVRNPTAFEDGVIAASLVTVAAESMGLGSFWNGVAKVLYRFVPRWRPGKAVSGRTRLCAVLCVGKPLYAGRPLPPRDWVLDEVAGRP